jgi:hypothetical protein
VIAALPAKHACGVSLFVERRAISGSGERREGSMESFEDFWKKLHVEVVDFAVYDWRTHRDAAISDGADFLEKTKGDIRRWCRLLGERKLSQDHFALLLAGKKDRAELAALRRQGLPETAADRFVTGLIDTVASTAYHFFDA